MEVELEQFALVTGDVTSHSASSIVINMPAGVDSSKLELIPDKSFAGTGISKYRQKQQREIVQGSSHDEPRMGLTTPDASGATSVTHRDNKGPIVVGDEIKASQPLLVINARITKLLLIRRIVYYDYLLSAQSRQLLEHLQLIRSPPPRPPLQLVAFQSISDYSCC